MLNELSDYLIALAEDPHQAEAFRAAPHAHMSRAGLSDEAQADLLATRSVGGDRNAVIAVIFSTI